MLENYYKDLFGIIHQKQISLENNKDYPSYYNDRSELSDLMSYLRLGYILGIIEKSNSDFSILDIGYGNGSFLRACSNIFNNCYGYDISNYSVPEKCENVIFDDIVGKQKKYFNIVTMFDSFEHFEDITFIKDLSCDYLVISVPNCEYGNDDIWFEKWKHRKPNEHLHHFNYDSLKNFCEYAGYQYITHSYIEDIIRRDPDNINNILTMVLKKI